MVRLPSIFSPGRGRNLALPRCRAAHLLPIGLALPFFLNAQAPAQTPEIGQILQRLDKLERDNRDLAAQVRQLQTELAAAKSAPETAAASAQTAPAPAPAPTTPTLAERVAIQQNRIEEQAQTKVEASQKFPIRITGMALFNAFLDSRYGGGAEYPTAASLTPSPETAHATLRQTTIGLEYYGPRTFLGGAVSGALAMDFFTGGVNFNSTFRLRTGSIAIDWKTTHLMAGIDKPIFNPREPSSLAQVGVSPLTGAGNLWLWLPQVRLGQDFPITNSTGFRARAGIVETHEAPPYFESGTNAVAVAPNRPGIEARLEFYHRLDSDRRLEVAAGYHESNTHAGGFSIPSRVYAGDWFFNPVKRVEWTGAFFTGQNVANLGTGAIDEGYAVFRHYAYAVTGRGAWTQLTVHTLRRLDFHLFTGLQYYESALLDAGDVTRNLTYGINAFYHLAPNVLFGPEISQFRTYYIATGTRLTNHYDLALAYLF